MPLSQEPSSNPTKTAAWLAQRLLGGILAGYDPAATVAVTVIDGVSNTSLLTGLGYTAGKLLKDAANAYPVGGGAPLSGTAAVRYNNGGYVFGCDAPSFEFWMRGGKWELYVDGKPAAGNPFTSSGDGYKKVDFGSAAQRLIEIRFVKSTGNLTGVALRKPYSMWPARPAFRGRVAVFGDSITEAVAYGDVTAPGEGWAMQLGRRCNWDTIAMGVGGTGYTTATPDDIGSRVEQLADYSDIDMVLFASGINDNAATPSVLTAKVSAAVSRVRQLMPDALIVVLGPWRAPGRNPAQSISDAIKAGFDAVADARMKYVDTYAENWQFGSDNGTPGGYKQSGEVTLTGALSAATSGTLTAPWAGASGSYTLVFDNGMTKTATLTYNSTSVSWTGAVTAGAGIFAYTSASGNSGNYLVNDTVHPGVVGHTYLARRVRDAVFAWFRSLV